MRTATRKRHLTITPKNPQFSEQNRPETRIAGSTTDDRTGSPVTARRWNGVAQPTTHPTARRSSNLFAGPARPATALSIDAAQTGLETVDVLAQNASEVADGFRWGYSLPARKKLRALTETADTLVVLASRLCAQSGGNLADLANQQPEIADAIGDLASAIDQLEMYEQDEDWTAVADTLDQEFAGAMTGWRALFVTLARIAASFDSGANVA